MIMRAPRPLIALLTCCALAPLCRAEAAPTRFVIGRTATGAVCAARPSRGVERVWRIQCDGETQTSGVLSDAPDTEPQGALKAMDGKIPCRAPEPLALEGLEGGHRTVCPARRDGRDWILFEAHPTGRPQRRLSLELPAELEDLAGPALRGALTAPESAPAPLVAETRWIDAYRVSQTGDFATAEQRFTDISLAASGADGQRAEAYLNWALESSNLGRPEAAAEHFRQADALIDVVKDPDLQALSALYKSIAARNEGRFADAVRWARQSIGAGETARPAEVGQPRSGPGEIRIDASTAARLNADGPGGEADCALNADSTCAPRFRDLRHAYAAYLAGTALEVLGEDAAATQALDDAAAHIASFEGPEPRPDAGAAWLKADIEAERARLALDHGDRALAVARARSARAAVRGSARLAGGERDAQTRLLLARAEAAQGETTQALADYDLAFDTLRTGGGGLTINPEDAEAFFDTLMRQGAKDSGADNARADRMAAAMESLQFDETGAGLQRLRRRLEQGSGPDAAPAKAAAAREALAVARLSVSGPTTDAADLVAFADARDRLTAAERSLFALHPELAGAGAQAVTLSEVRAALAKGELYVKIWLFANRGYGVAITSSGARAYRIRIGRKEAMAQIEALRRPFDDPIRLTRFDVEASHRLFAALFGPVAEDAAQASRLIYDADGSLLGLPPALFVTDEASVRRYQANLRASRETGQYSLDLYGGVNWLGRVTEVTSSLSLRRFLDLRRSRPSAARRAYAGFGGLGQDAASDPNVFAAITKADPYAPECADARRDVVALAEQAPPRPAATTAIRTIAFGVSADQAPAASPLSDYRVVLIGGRGLTPLPNGCLGAPALVASLGDTATGGLLTTDRIADLKLDAELVVVTGWNTGDPTDPQIGDSAAADALTGLDDAFVAAGGRNLLFSHWDAPTRATVQLITETLSARDAEAAALRRSQLRLMDAPSTSHPYYWAGFALVGDGARSLSASPR